MCTGFELLLPEILGGGAAAAGAAEVGLGLGAVAADAGLASGLAAGGASFGGAAAGLSAAEGFGAGLGLFGGSEALGALGVLGAGEAAIGSGAGLGLGGGDLGAGVWAGSGDAGEYIFGSGGPGDSGLTSGLSAGGETFGGLSPSAMLGDTFALSGATALSGGGPGLFDQALGAFQKYGQPAMSAYSGISGLQRAAQMRKMAALAAKRADPWGQSGGRSLADSQLQELMRDPSQVAASDPAFKLRVMGAQRANAQFGQDSGAMNVAGANASTTWYNERLAQLAGLSGAGVNPGAAQQVGLQGMGQAAELESSALGSLGYAAAGAGAGKGGLTPQQQQLLLKMAMGG